MKKKAPKNGKEKKDKNTMTKVQAHKRTPKERATWNEGKN
jgi:hypothetical protein